MTNDQIMNIAVEYRDHYARMEDLAGTYGITRQGIFKILQKCGVDTSKAQRVERICYTCGAPVLRRRGMARKTKRSFCDDECYMTYLETLGEDYRPSEYHSRVARRVVKENFPEYNPEKGHVVHHVDKDCEHNALKNLEVYACQGDHLRKHRGQDIKPIWRGVDLL